MTSQPVANATVVWSPTFVVNNARMKYNKKVLTGLGIAEVVIGSLAIVFSCISLGYVNDQTGDPFFPLVYYPYRRFSIGEGIWSGVWILTGGALGIACGRKRPTLCLINCHMGFSIVGAVFAAALLSTGIATAVINSSRMLIALESLLAIGGFVTFFLCIVSAVYCCKLNFSAGFENCCGPCCKEQATPIGKGQVVYVTNLQRDQQVQQTFVQGRQPTTSGQQGSYPGNVVTVMQPGVAVGNQPTLFPQQPAFVGQHHVLIAQQRAFATQQPALGSQQQISPLLKLTPQSESKSKEQEAMSSSANAATSADHGDSPPSYFQDQ